MDRIRTFSETPRSSAARTPRRRKRLARYARGTSLACLLLLAPAMDACQSSQSSGEAPRIDMSSDDAAARSIERVREKLDEEQRRQLTDATLVLVRHEMRVDYKAPLDPDRARAALKKVLDGKTAGEVIEQARVVEANSPVPLSDKSKQGAGAGAGAGAGPAGGASTPAGGGAAGSP